MKYQTTRTILSLLATSAACFLAPEASATQALSRTLVDVTIEGSNFARLSVSGSAVGGRPGCHSPSATVHWAWDISTNKGRAMLATAQAALLAGKKVNVAGGTTCVNGIEGLTILTIWAN